MKSIKTLMRSVSPRIAGFAMIALATIALPLALNAWGPERTTYTIEKPATKVTFNSITNNPHIGDERNFVGIRESGTTGLWKDSQTAQPGKEYVVRMYVHNNAADNLNLVAKDVTAKFNLPTTTAKTIQVQGFLSSSNATPTEVYDHADFTASENFNLAVVAGSIKYYNNANGNGFTIPESVFTSTGAKLGYDKMDGNIPGCFQYAGYLTFIVKPQFATTSDFTVEKKVSKHGENKWVEDYAAQPGETVDYLLKYKNTGTAQHNGVTFRDKLPTHMTYVAGSTIFGNSKTPNGVKASDNVTGAGINVGSYAPGANAWVIFSAKVAEKSALTCGPNTLRNVVSVNPEGQTPKEDDANVTVKKVCEETPKPKTIVVCSLADKTYPVTINEEDFDSSKHSKNPADCKVTPVTPEVPKTPETPAELPETGILDGFMGIAGLGSLVGAASYYRASRRAL